MLMLMLMPMHIYIYTHIHTYRTFVVQGLDRTVAGTLSADFALRGPASGGQGFILGSLKLAAPLGKQRVHGPEVSVIESRWLPVPLVEVTPPSPVLL